MSDMFTTDEYIAKHGLAVDKHDGAAKRMISEHLRKLGYVKLRRRNRWYWVQTGHGRGDQRAKLQGQLNKLEGNCAD